MKKIIALVLISMLFATAAQAATWPEGRSAARPYEGTTEVDLTTTMGYILLHPRANVMPASSFCDTLTIYLPREDIKLAQGTARLYRGKEEVASFDFTDPTHTHLRKLTEAELERLMWGGGVCVEMFLDVSLTIGEDYYVLMDEGCFTTTDETLKSLAITNPDAWKITVTGDFGVNGLFYAAPVEEGQQSVASIQHNVGDEIHFDLLMGGDAKTAVVYSDNDSVAFDARTFEESGAVTGVVTQKDLRWGVVFLNENGEPVGVVRLGD